MPLVRRPSAPASLISAALSEPGPTPRDQEPKAPTTTTTVDAWLEMQNRAEPTREQVRCPSLCVYMMCCTVWMLRSAREPWP